MEEQVQKEQEIVMYVVIMNTLVSVSTSVMKFLPLKSKLNYTL